MSVNFINRQDFKNEIFIADLLQNYLKETDPNHNYRFIPSAQSLYARAFDPGVPNRYTAVHDPHDFDVWKDHLHIAVLEVKHRNREMNDIKKRGGPLMSSQKVRNLEYYFLRRGFWVWFAWYCKPDDGLILCDYRKWKRHNGHQFIASKAEACKDDHGTKEKKHDPKDFKFPPVACTFIENALARYGNF